MGMMAAVAQARKAARRAAEVLYEHSCDISEYRMRRRGGESKQIPVVVQKNVPCRLVFTASMVNQTVSTADIDYDALVIMPPDIAMKSDINVKPGSLLTITEGGGTHVFEQSGDPVVFATHQEIKVRRVDKA